METSGIDMARNDLINKDDGAWGGPHAELGVVHNGAQDEPQAHQVFCQMRECRSEDVDLSGALDFDNRLVGIEAIMLAAALMFSLLREAEAASED
mmetsp:Transcript_23886/g.74387  ORF Transcript_23886/g.74387 Transcript_23886/m.74387 type:complete len:95 (+) Transcript_23886:470-754(+)